MKSWNELTPTERRIEILTQRLNNLAPSAPLRIKVAITAELRSLGWGRK
jgi:hypothetical protein